MRLLDTDRRMQVRFDVLGVLPGTIVVNEALRVVNIGASGALVDAELPLPLNAEYQMRLVVASHVSDARVKVRRVTEHRPQAAAVRYWIGLEFLEITADAQEAIERLVASAAGGPSNAELGAG